MRWRRATSIFSYWRAGQFIIENYRTGALLSANPVTTQVLHVFADWRSVEEAHQELPQYGYQSLARSIKHLAREGLLVREGSPQAKQDQCFVASWSPWLPHAAILHFGTKDMPYTTSEAQIAKHMRSYLRQSPQPDFFKSSGAKGFSLPKVQLTDSELSAVLLNRRTHREFSPGELELNDLSALLFYTWGVTGFIDSSVLGYLPQKTSPSAGARHPCEVYVLARKVTNVAPGLYHYAANKHTLRQVSAGIPRGRASQYCAGQNWVGRAAALFLITAVFPRSMWKYRFPRAYRTVILDAGHLCQTFCLVATHLGLAPFSTMALKDSLIERDLGIDGFNEAILYVAGVGLSPRPSSR
ncbi:MAG: SagB family peptide dehydrogenase [Candidatus Korobacteraceae bacterium]